MIGYEITALSAGNLIGSWIATKTVEKFNPFRLSNVSLMLQGICFITLAFTKNPIILASTIFIYGASGYAYISYNNYLIPAAAGEQDKLRAHAISYTSIASNLGILIGGMIVNTLSSKYAFLIFNLVGITLVFISLIIKPENFILSQVSQEKTYHKNQNRTLYLLALAIVFLMGIIIAQQRVGYQIFLENSFSSYQVNMILMLNSILIIAFLPALTQHLLLYDKVKSLALGCSALSLGMFLTVSSTQYIFILFLCLIRTAGEMMTSTLSQALCFQNANIENRGKAMAFYKLLFSVGILLGSLLGSNLLNAHGLMAIWDLCGIIGCCMVLLILFVKTRKKHTTSSPFQRTL